MIYFYPYLILNIVVLQGLGVKYTNFSLDKTTFLNDINIQGYNKINKSYEICSFIIHSGAWRFYWGVDGTEGEVILKKGDIARIVIPPEKAYGTNGISGLIPPNSPLYFEVEILDVEVTGEKID